MSRLAALEPGLRQGREASRGGMAEVWDAKAEDGRKQQPPRAPEHILLERFWEGC